MGLWAATTYNGVSGTGPSSLGNPELQWESTREFNIGADVSIWAGRVQANIDYYEKFTSELLLNRPLPTTTGFGAILGNVGNVSNKGVELNVTSVNIDRADLTWRTNFNLSRNANLVESLASGCAGINIKHIAELFHTFNP